MTTANVVNIHEGRKTQTRRQVAIPPFDPESDIIAECPYGQAGDYLAMKETSFYWGYWFDQNLGLPGKAKWAWVDETDEAHPVLYRSDFFKGYDKLFFEPKKIHRSTLGYHKRPSMFLKKPDWRTFLKITEVRVERLQDISEADSKEEGCHGKSFRDGTMILSPRAEFLKLWDSINGTPKPNKPDISWKANPWVWALTFELVPRLNLKPEGTWSI